jgi:hypothetical protein
MIPVGNINEKPVPSEIVPKIKNTARLIVAFFSP